MTEEWRKIQGYDKYEVSNLGQVRRGGRVLKPFVFPDKKTSYLRVSLSKDGVQTVYQIHRLIALAFLPNPDNKPTVNHRDHNGLNNSLENLEWATHSEQRLHSPRPVGVSNTRHIYQNKSGSWYIQFKKQGKTIYTDTFPTLPEAVEARDNYTLLLDGRTG
jgi:hypothetical protein